MPTYEVVLDTWFPRRVCVTPENGDGLPMKVDVLIGKSPGNQNLDRRASAAWVVAAGGEPVDASYATISNVVTEAPYMPTDAQLITEAKRIIAECLSDTTKLPRARALKT